MPRRIDIEHYLLHFRLERDDDTASVEVKRRSGAIVTAFETAPTDSQTPLNFLIARMTGVVGPGKADADVIRDVADELKRLNTDGSPTELLGFMQIQGVI